MNKQSSIEWLIEELNHNIEFIPLAHWDKIRDIVQQAKAMHKEEMKELYLSHVTKAERLKKIFEKQFEELYNETFGGNNE